MDIDVNVSYVETILESDTTHHEEALTTNTMNKCDNSITNQDIPVSNEIAEKHSAVWTTSATITLLKLYELKLEMLETPKKKTRIWIAISDNLKDYNIEMTPDQVRWKINALAKKYKQCIDSGQHDRFKYFKQMDKIYAQYNVDCDSYTIQNIETSQKNRNSHKVLNGTSSAKLNPESKAMIELRKIRLANRIESDRSQSKINLEKQWLDYLKRQEEQKRLRDELHNRRIILREEELKLKKKELEMKEALELKKIDLKEKQQEEILHMEREKCEMLKKIFSHHLSSYN